MGTLFGISTILIDLFPGAHEAKNLASSIQSDLLIGVLPSTYEPFDLWFFVRVGVFIAFFIAFIKVEKLYRSRLKPETVKPS
jgi:hypothetical protein